MDIARTIYERMAREKAQEEERRIITDYTTAGAITPKGINSAIKELLTAADAAQLLELVKKPQHLVIANATTAAVIRKNFDRETVEVIVTQAVETGTAYIVTNEDLKAQLLAAMGERW